MNQDGADKGQRINRLLSDIDRGDDSALDQLVAEIYPDLKKLAHFQRAGERAGHTLNTTAIVHEAFVRLAASGGSYTDQRHFLRAAATVMRHLLVDHARKRNAGKRGAGVQPATLQDELHSNDDDTLAVLAVDAAIRDIAAIDPDLERIIECRYFGGLTVRETADTLGLSVRTVERGWRRARGYLMTALEPDVD